MLGSTPLKEIVPSGDQLIQNIAKETDTVYMGFSAGKDSIATWLKLRPHFKKIVPIHFYFLPNLRLVEEPLQYYEEFFDTHIMRLPHPMFYINLQSMLFQSPTRYMVTQCFKYVDYFVEDAIRWTMTANGDNDAWIATGMKQQDSIVFSRDLRKGKGVDPNKRLFYPIWDLTKDECLSLLRDNNCKLPNWYHLWNKSFEKPWIAKFSLAIKKYWPDDYEIIKKWYPLIELDQLRYELCPQN